MRESIATGRCAGVIDGPLSRPCMRSLSHEPLHFLQTAIPSVSLAASAVPRCCVVTR